MLTNMLYQANLGTLLIKIHYTTVILMPIIKDKYKKKVHMRIMEDQMKVTLKILKDLFMEIVHMKIIGNNLKEKTLREIMEDLCVISRALLKIFRNN